MRSFRTTDADRQIREGQAVFRLVGRVALHAGRVVPIGIERRQGNYTIHVAGEPVRRLSDLAGNFPVHIMTGDTATVLSGGPRYRRQMLDWALFHVEHGYRLAWQRYARSLRQRNAALRVNAPVSQIVAWDRELVDAGNALDDMRHDYLRELEPLIAAEDPTVRAVASNDAPPTDKPVIGLDDIPAIADFILSDLGMELRKTA